MGYIVGAKMAELCGSWQWGLRATPVMGILAVLLILLLLQDPPRGESEGHQHLQAQTYGVRGGQGGTARLYGVRASLRGLTFLLGAGRDRQTQHTG